MPLRVYDINGAVKTTSSGTIVTSVTAASPLASSGGATPQISVANQNANLFLAGPTSGGAAAPTFRAPVIGDLTAAGLYPLTGYALLEHQETSGTNGGSLTSGADRTLTITNEIYDIGSIVSIGSNQFTLVGTAAGYTYRIYCWQTFYKTDGTQMILRDVTGAADLVRGLNAYSSSTDSTPVYVFLTHRFTITANNTFEMRIRGTTTQATNGMGVATSLGTERYMELFIVRE